ncbi:MAG: 6-phosphogluconolactonase, partial [Pseudomonadota bacterium]
MALTEHRYKTKVELQRAVSQWSIDVLQKALTTQPAVSVLLSGGSTPLPVYEQLAQAALPWDCVHLAQVDERWVEPDHELSNERAIRAAFAGKLAALKNFVAMKRSTQSAAIAVDDCNRRYAALPPPALCILGMGMDGHTASLFPAAAGLTSGLTSHTPCAAIEARPSAVTGTCTERMTMTLWALLKSTHIALLITGDDKWKVYQSARAHEDKSLPVSLLLKRAASVDVFWSP